MCRAIILDLCPNVNLDSEWTGPGFGLSSAHTTHSLRPVISGEFPIRADSVTNELALDLLIDLVLSYPNNDRDPNHDVRVSSSRLAGPGRGCAVPGPDRWVTGYAPLCTPESFRA